MTTRRNRRRHEESDKQPGSGLFPVPSDSRVARRGSTRVEPAPLADAMPRGRGIPRAESA
jgi:hypothetical protein